MNYAIRPYRHTDFKEIASWWQMSTGQTPATHMMVEDGTFILEIDNKPALALTTLLTQSKDMAYLFSFIKNPVFKQTLETYGKILWDHCSDYAKEKGYTRVICFADETKLADKYLRFGMQKTSDKLTGFVRIF